MKIILTALFVITAPFTAFGIWAIASYIDALCSPLLQTWNMWALLLGL